MNSEPERIEIPLPGGGVMAFRHLVPIKPFRMGARGEYDAEEPVHEVRLMEDFWMAETAVTQRQFALWSRAKQIEHENMFADHPDHPAENLDWYQANRFCDWLTNRLEPQAKPSGFYRFCLPTEAEWEYACRAGTETEYSSGDGEEALARVGWYVRNAENGSTYPAAQKLPNAFGFFDLHGNVWEWCHDVWDGELYRGRAEGDLDPGWLRRAADWEAGLEAIVSAREGRVVRGGSWDVAAWVCRSAFRFRRRPGVRDGNYGFRVCLVRGPSASPGAEAPLGPGDAVRGKRTKSDGPSGAGAERRSSLPKLGSHLPNPRFPSVDF